MLDEKGLGRRVQDARLAAGFTQQSLCQKANLSYSTLAKIERGAIRSPSIFTIESIVEALGISLDELLGRQPAQPAKAHSKSGIRFVYFDVNGCLVRSYQRAFEKLGHDSGQPVDIVETFFWHYNDMVCRGDMTLEDFNSQLAKHLHLASVSWSDYYLAEIEAMPHMKEVVQWTAQHYGIGLMTNIMPGLLDAMRQRGIIPNVSYDAVIDSSVVHVIKPEAKMYDIAIEKSREQPAAVLLIDDSRTNLMAAEKMGMHVIWFDDSRPEESADKIKQVLEPVTDEVQMISAVESENSNQLSSVSVPMPTVVEQPQPAASQPAEPQSADTPGQ